MYTMSRSFMFTAPLKFVEQKNANEKDLFVEGFISTTGKDLVNDVMTQNCQKSMSEQGRSRAIKLDIEHEAFRGDSHEEKEINKTKIPAGKITELTVTSKGLKVRAIINKFHKDFKNIAGNIQNGFLDAFSVAFIPTRVSKKNVNGETIRLLDDVKLLNVALTGNPINTEAQIVEVFMKSMDSVEEKVMSTSSGTWTTETTTDANEVVEDSEEVEQKKQGDAAKKLRRQATSDNDSDDEEDEELKKYKKEKKNNPIKEFELEVKAYEKDGAHAHTEAMPLGEHTHPEIEKVLKEQFTLVHERIDRLFARVSDSELAEPVSKSHSSELSDSKRDEKGGKNMSETEENTTTETQEEVVTSEEAKETTEAPAKEVEGAKTEGSAESEGLEEIKAQVEALKKEVKNLTELKAAKIEANHKTIAESKATETQTEVKGAEPIDNIM